MNLPETAEEVEVAVRAALIEKCQSVALCGQVWGHEFVVDSRHEYFEKLGVENGDRTEIIATFVEFEGFEDTASGCDEDPVYKLLYRVKLERQFVDEREDETTSSADFAKCVMRLRAAFLVDRDLDFDGVVFQEPLVQIEKSDLRDCEMTGVFGHNAAFRVKVEIIPYG